MTITLTDELEALITAKVKSGAYKSANEVVMESLRLLKAKEEGMESLRREIMRGIEDIENGRFSTYSNDEELENLYKRVISQESDDNDNSKN